MGILALTLRSFMDEMGWHLVSLGILVAVTVGLHVLIRGVGDTEERARGLLPLIVGKDKRVSTSKVQIVLWSYAVAFGLLSALFHLGTDDFGEVELGGEYLILLGSPAAAALLAKTFTVSKLQSGTIIKPDAQDEPGLASGVSQVVTDDEGRADLFDFQYFLFTLVALTYFFWRFFLAPENGLPNLPETLVALTGVSAASYVTKKGLEREIPLITAVYPTVAARGDPVTIRTRNVVTPAPVPAPAGAEPDAGDIVVLFGGRTALNPVAHDDGTIEANVPSTVEPGKPAPVQVVRAYDEVTVKTEEAAFTVASEPTVTPPTGS